MRVRPLLVLLSFICLAVPSFAQSTSTPPATSDFQAAALLQKSLAALTGGATVTDVTLTGSARRIAGSDDETGTATLQADSVGDSRVELSFASGNRIEIRNHSALPLPGSLPSGVPVAAAQMPQAVGAWIGPDGVSHGMAPHNIMTDSSWFFPALIFQNVLASQNYALSYVGQETHNGATVLHVSALEQFPQLATAEALSRSAAIIPTANNGTSPALIRSGSTRPTLATPSRTMIMRWRANTSTASAGSRLWTPLLPTAPIPNR